jgi:hypothetical protein
MEEELRLNSKELAKELQEEMGVSWKKGSYSQQFYEARPMRLLSLVLVYITTNDATDANPAEADLIIFPTIIDSLLFSNKIRIVIPANAPPKPIIIFLRAYPIRLLW